ncbi:MAG: YeaC family protein [Halioglobus sp.]
MDYLELVADMSPEVYKRLKQALEIGRWPDGKALTAEQKQNALQAVIAWGELHLDAEQRVGFIDRGHRAGDTCDDTGARSDGESTAPQTLKWQED